MKNPPVTIGIDPAALNGDRSAMAVIQGNRIQSVVFDEFEKLMAKHAKALQQSPRLNKMSGTVTGRITSLEPSQDGHTQL